MRAQTRPFLRSKQEKLSLVRVSRKKRLVDRGEMAAACLAGGKAYVNRGRKKEKETKVRARLSGGETPMPMKFS